MDTHLYDLCVRSEAVKQEAYDSQVPTVQHQLLWSELQRGVWSHQLGPVWAHCNTGGEGGAKLNIKQINRSRAKERWSMGYIHTYSM